MIKSQIKKDEDVYSRIAYRRIDRRQAEKKTCSTNSKVKRRDEEKYEKDGEDMHGFKYDMEGVE